MRECDRLEQRGDKKKKRFKRRGDDDAVHRQRGHGDARDGRREGRARGLATPTSARAPPKRQRATPAAASGTSDPRYTLSLRVDSRARQSFNTTWERLEAEDRANGVRPNAGVPTAMASMGVRPNGSWWAWLTIAAAPRTNPTSPA